MDLVVGGRREDFEASGVELRFPTILLAMLRVVSGRESDRGKATKGRVISRQPENRSAPAKLV